ncbi:putative mucin TcSMUGS [Trypanosoma cruzi]|uniref:Putative mucin TcSMUGS n=1 Tax=Trypanosoma cruzi TaxID=5693 RepID=A0A2V2V9L5_TRYCR|nr:putative mucin TcSMUGS [Trypanosoma cruzi]
MMLRRVLCVLFFALCCACVCATAQEEGQYDAAVVEAGDDPDQTTTTTTTNNNNYDDDDHYQCTRQEHNHLQGTDSWRRERPRRPFVGSGAAAAACQCRCGDRRCCVLRTGRGACAVGLESRCVRPLLARAGAPTGARAALGVTHREVRRVYLSTLQRCGCIYAIVFG